VLTAAELLHEVLVVPRHAYLPLPDQRVIERPEWFQVISPSIKHGSMNGVDLAVIAAADVDRVIDATIAEYRGLGCKFRWAVGPDSAPGDLGDRLEHRGLVRREVVSMARATGELAGHSEIAVERVTAASFDAFATVMASGWTGELAAVRQVYGVALETELQWLYLARVAGEPAGGAAMARFAKSAHLRSGVVLPAFRGRGVYRELVRARLADAATSGIALATTHARAATSAPGLAKMGFAEVARGSVYSS
jgi:GNAT superfamily N-acetyltransferase